METVRNAYLNISYNGTDISEDVSKGLVSATYTDSAAGRADDLQVTLEDTKALWQGAWFPEEGAVLKASLVCRNWRKAGADLTLPFGKFEIDEIDLNGPPDTVTMKSVSVDIKGSMRLENKTKGWENVRIETIAEEIAGCHGLTLYWDAGVSIEFGRVEQRDQSDGRFLEELCGKNGLTMKVSGGKLIIYDGKDYDERPPVYTVTRSDGEVLDHHFSSKSHDVYRACTVLYSDADTGDELSYTFTDPDASVCGHTLKINERVESLAAAQKKAMAELRKKNKNKVTGDLTLLGCPELAAGVNIAVVGYGAFDGAYHVEEARHEHGSGGYTTALNIRKTVLY